jgi:hypothetical protein
MRDPRRTRRPDPVGARPGPALGVTGDLSTLRLSAQLLGDPSARSPTEVADRLLAIQAQDFRGAQLAIRARSTGLLASDLADALNQERSLVITTLNRGTLHLVRSEDYGWLHALTAPTVVTANARRLMQEGVAADAADRAVGVIVRALADEGPLGRDALRRRVAASGIETRGQALVHILLLAALRGLVVRGPLIDGRPAFVLTGDWLGAPAGVDRDAALAELARRYLAGHGPASAGDLAKWSGLALRDVRAGLRILGSRLVEREDRLLTLRGVPAPVALPAPRLLGPFDPVLLGWRSREDIVGSHGGIVTTNGIFRPIALVGGRAAATWTLRAGRVGLAPVAPRDNPPGRVAVSGRRPATPSTRDRPTWSVTYAPSTTLVRVPGTHHRVAVRLLPPPDRSGQTTTCRP